MSAFHAVPRLEGRNPFKVIRQPGEGYSCRGVKPYAVQRESGLVPGTATLATAALIVWDEDPRGDCGKCAACRAQDWGNGVWSILRVEA